jgi:hypothetical protein
MFLGFVDLETFYRKRGKRKRKRREVGRKSKCYIHHEVRDQHVNTCPTRAERGIMESLLPVSSKNSGFTCTRSIEPEFDLSPIGIVLRWLAAAA